MPNDDLGLAIMQQKERTMQRLKWWCRHPRWLLRYLSQGCPWFVKPPGLVRESLWIKVGARPSVLQQGLGRIPENDLWYVGRNFPVLAETAYQNSPKPLEPLLYQALSCLTHCSCLCDSKFSWKVLAAHVQSPKAMGKCGKPMETCRRVVTRAAQHSGTYQRRELKLPAGAAWYWRTRG